MVRNSGEWVIYLLDKKIGGIYVYAEDWVTKGVRA